jgi:predicted nucleotidyltransferase
VGEEPELYVFDFSDAPGAAEYRERLERDRTEARRRYRDHLAAVFDLHGLPDPGALSDVALDALTGWRYIDSGERCSCSCHPRLPESDFHDYGFGCVCAQTPEDRRRAFDRWRNDIHAFWESPEGQRIKAAERAAEAELEAWLVAQPGVVVHTHGGLAPEQWRRDEVLRLAHDFGLKNPRVFGSAARGEDLPGSDLDLVVTVPRGKGLFALIGFAHAVEDLLGVHVDVVSEGGLGERHAAICRHAVPV